MSTHRTKCVVCEEDCYCYNDAHALGCGGPNGNGGCQEYPSIEFCSLDCALELQKRLVKSIANYQRVVKENNEELWGV